VSTDEKTEKKPQPTWSLHTELKMKSFPILFIKANPQNDFWVCGQVKSSVTSNPERPKNQRYWWVEFVPDLQSFAVWYHEVGREAQLEYVPLMAARTWAPLMPNRP